MKWRASTNARAFTCNHSRKGRSHSPTAFEYLVKFWWKSKNKWNETNRKEWSWETLQKSNGSEGKIAEAIDLKHVKSIWKWISFKEQGTH